MVRYVDAEFARLSSRIATPVSDSLARNPHALLLAHAGEGTHHHTHKRVPR